MNKDEALQLIEKYWEAVSENEETKRKEILQTFIDCKLPAVSSYLSCSNFILAQIEAVELTEKMCQADMEEK